MFLETIHLFLFFNMYSYLILYILHFNILYKYIHNQRFNYFLPFLFVDKRLLIKLTYDLPSDNALITSNLSLSSLTG